ncbi:uncharacterized protein ACB057_013165 [Neosynchiropus ocellatus]
MLTESIFPLTLAVMSLERYVAVCFPLRHSSIVTMRSTAAAITLVWAFSFVNVLIRVVLMLIITARSASTDRNSARKALSTLLLHMIQLGLEA